jgi:hypothetical protein
MVSLNPLENTGPATLTVPAAFRAWSHWTNRLGIGCLQVPALYRDFEGQTSDAARDQLLAALCEVYSRGIFETAIGIHFDRIDSLADVHVLQLVSERFGHHMAELVHASVSANGPVVRTLDAVFSLPLPGEQTGPQ